MLIIQSFMNWKLICSLWHAFRFAWHGKAQSGNLTQSWKKIATVSGISSYGLEYLLFFAAGHSLVDIRQQILCRWHLWLPQSLQSVAPSAWRLTLCVAHPQLQWKHFLRQQHARSWVMYLWLPQMQLIACECFCPKVFIGSLLVTPGHSHSIEHVIVLHWSCRFPKCHMVLPYASHMSTCHRQAHTSPCEPYCHHLKRQSRMFTVVFTTATRSFSDCFGSHHQKIIDDKQEWNGFCIFIHFCLNGRCQALRLLGYGLS